MWAFSSQSFWPQIIAGIHRVQGCEAWAVQSCSLFDSTLLVSARVHITQAQLIHLLTGWDSPVSVSINLLLLPPDCLRQHELQCITACPPWQGVTIGHIKANRPQLYRCKLLTNTFYVDYLCLYAWFIQYKMSNDKPCKYEVIIFIPFKLLEEYVTHRTHVEKQAKSW